MTQIERTDRLSLRIKLVWLLGLITLTGSSVLWGCNPNTIQDETVPDIVVRVLTSTAIQEAIDAAPATGARIILPPGDYNATARVNLTSKNNITIDGQGKANWVGSSSVPNLFALLGTCRNIRLTGINFSTTAGPGSYQYGLICAFEQSFIDGYEIDHCTFTSPNAPINLISFVPYSPINESGNGRGAMQRNINIHDCVGKDGGRAFCELNSHVHADNKTTAYFENFRFSHNTVTNMGTKDRAFGPALSLSGIGNNIQVDSNDITDTQYCGLEFVSNRNVSSTNNHFTGVQNDFSAYSISQAGANKTSGVTLSNNRGTVKGRAYILHDVDSFSVTDDSFITDKKVELIRASNGSLRGLTLTVTNDVNAMLVDESQAVAVTNSSIRLTQSTNAASVVTIPGNSQRIVIQNNTLARSTKATGEFVQSVPSSGNTIGPNIEQTH
ncbi:right-handed parallel beta-helix repeat-containing protein [Spirosoma validum]|uniref:Right handed beta helix domain-containing protein n=1 Tax=Spirosoma validum TaxID=2771355 RepID=A0A927AZ33_9BACT|nr:hypothetical protein [Spirosoma validum]MBD2752297.1 hypothetical protein [Spirosoma validum]